MATLQDILSGNFPAAQRYAEGYAQMPSYLQDPYLGLSTSNIGNVTKGLLSKTQFEKAQKVASKNAETLLGLPKGNTAMDRAKAMGFNVDNPMYHGTYKDYQSIDPNKSFYVTPNPEYASLYTNPSASSMGGKKASDFIDPQGNVMKVLIKDENILNTTTPQGLNVFNKEFYGQYGNATPLGNRGYPDWTDAEDFAQMFADKNMPYKGVMVDEGKTPSFTGGLFDRGISTAIFDPKQVRSVNAAFDPARASENDILAATLAIPVSGLLEQPKDKKKKK
jgi:hypothetical protein